MAVRAARGRNCVLRQVGSARRWRGTDQLGCGRATLEYSIVSSLNGGGVTPFRCRASASDCQQIHVGGRDMD
eukprot:4557259-Prymnesium_polylepis.1